MDLVLRCEKFLREDALKFADENEEIIKRIGKYYGIVAVKFLFNVKWEFYIYKTKKAIVVEVKEIKE